MEQSPVTANYVRDNKVLTELKGFHSDLVKNIQNFAK